MNITQKAFTLIIQTNNTSCILLFLPLLFAIPKKGSKHAPRRHELSQSQQMRPNLYIPLLKYRRKCHFGGLLSMVSQIWVISLPALTIL